MTEVRTEPVDASFVETEAEFFDGDMMARKAGSIWISDPGAAVQRWYYACPCGCGDSGALRVGLTKPEQTPSWAWNGSKEKPTLQPSVWYIGHWHGFLTDGKWISC